MEKLETFTIPIPETSEEKDKMVEEENKKLEEFKEELEQSDIDKSGDIYGGLSYDEFVSIHGIDKTLEYLKASNSLLGRMQGEHRRWYKQAKLDKSKQNYEKSKNIRKTVNDDLKRIVEELAEENANGRIERINQKFAWSDKQFKKISDFSESRQKWIKDTVKDIENIDSPDKLKERIYDFFKEKVGSKEKPKFTKIIEEKLKPVEEEIMPWYNNVMSVYNLIMGLGADLGAIVDALKMMALLQFYPFIVKYKQYKAVVDDLKKTAIEMELILDALKRKADEYGDEAGIDIPPLPPIPDLPTLPDLPI